MYIIDSINIESAEHFEKLLNDLHLDTLPIVRDISLDENLVSFVHCKLSGITIRNNVFKKNHIYAVKFEKCRLDNVTIESISALKAGIAFNRSFLHHLTIDKLDLTSKHGIYGDLSFRKCEIDELSITNSSMQELRISNSNFYISDIPNVIKNVKTNSIIFSFATLVALKMINCIIKEKNVFLYDSIIHSSFNITGGNLKDITKYQINDSMFKANPFDEPICCASVIRDTNSMIYYFPESNWVIDNYFHGSLESFCKRVESIYGSTNKYNEFQEVINYFKSISRRKNE